MKCYAPWHSLLIRFNGDVTPDGVYWNRYGNIFTDDLPDILNSKVAKETRQSFINNSIPEECRQCPSKEKISGHSRRMFFRDLLNPVIDKERTYTDEFIEVRFLELNMSNICNLKCRMCNGISSSAWIKEEQKLNLISTDYQRPVDHPEFGYHNMDPAIVDRLFKHEEYFQNLSYLSLKGGEPYMEPANKLVLQKLIDMKIAPNITLDVTTNGTIVDEEFHKLALQFGETKWTVSLEGTGQLYEYIRGGNNFTFEQLENNLKKYFCFDRVIIAVTIMAYNICHLEEIKTWYLKNRDLNWEIYFNNIVATPPYLNPSILPQEILDNAKNNTTLENLKFVHDENLSKHFKTFLNFTKDLDTIRGTNLLNVCPEFKEYI